MYAIRSYYEIAVHLDDLGAHGAQTVASEGARRTIAAGCDDAQRTREFHAVGNGGDVLLADAFDTVMLAAGTSYNFV